MSEANGIEVRYNDMDSLRATLVGRRIVAKRLAARSEFGDLPGYSHGANAVEFTLDDGTKLYAIDADGGCACSNGCFWVSADCDLPENAITDVELVEEKNEAEYDTSIRLFVYSAGQKVELFNSHGDDNGYYGWGHHIAVRRLEPVQS